MKPCVLTTAALAFAALACASTRGGGDVRSDPNLITREQLDSTAASSLFDAVRRLRPRWLQTRGVTSLSDIQTGTRPLVYVDNMHFGDTEDLRSLRLADVEFVRFLSPADAQMRFGATGATSGVIEVATRGRARDGGAPPASTAVERREGRTTPVR